MMGSGRLKKDPVVGVINNQINSPGGVQQVGIGTISRNQFSTKPNTSWLQQSIAR
jgi:hypothetical protein